MQSTLHGLTERDIEPVIDLARRIWVAHYVPIVGGAQVEYMLALRFTEENLSRYLGAADRWFDVLGCGGQLQGYCSYSLSGGPSTEPELKLEQLYLLAELRGRGLGGLMLRHVTDRAVALGCASVALQVNKRNTGSIAFYERSGFSVREAAHFDIGGGFVMDDYVMEKRLGRPNPK